MVIIDHGPLKLCHRTTFHLSLIVWAEHIHKYQRGIRSTVRWPWPYRNPVGSGPGNGLVGPNPPQHVGVAQTVHCRIPGAGEAVRKGCVGMSQKKSCSDWMRSCALCVLGGAFTGFAVLVSSTNCLNLYPMKLWKHLQGSANVKRSFQTKHL